MLQCGMSGRLVQEHAVHFEGAGVQDVDEPFSEQIGATLHEHLHLLYCL